MTDTQGFVTLAERTFTLRLLGDPKHPLIEIAKTMTERDDLAMHNWMDTALNTCLEMGNEGGSFLKLERTE